jgi:hypothetical protein
MRFIASGVAVLGVCLVGAGSLASVGWAVELPEFTVETTATGTSGTATLETNAAIVGKITCNASTEETAAISKQLGTFHAHFTGCVCKKTSALGGGTAVGETLGDSVGIDLTLGSFRLVRLASGKVGIWGLLTPLDVDCLYATEELLNIKGNELASIEPLLTKTKTFTVKAEQSGGKQAITEYENDGGTKVAVEGIKIEVANTGGFIRGATEVHGGTTTTSSETEIVKTT